MNKVNIEDINKYIQGYNIFICSSSFEDRCLEVANHVEISQFDKILVCHFKDNYQESNNNLCKLQEKFGEKCDVILLEKDSPLNNYDAIYDKLLGITFEKALLDISTFTREIFLIIIKLFNQDLFKDRILTMLYNPSDKYSNVSKDNFDQLWLSKGVKEIRTVVGYAGDFSPIKKDLLIVLVGFEAERSQVLIDNFEAECLYIGKAPKEESANEELASINELNFEMLLRNNPSAQRFDFSCKDIDFSIHAISEIVQAHSSDYNIIISPMCNKISTLAAAAVTYKYPEVQICYAATNLYNTIAYSTPTNNIYIIEASELYN